MTVLTSSSDSKTSGSGSADQQLNLVRNPDSPGDSGVYLSMESRHLVLTIHQQMRMLAGPHPELEDLAQVALEQVLQANFEGRSKPTTFTYSICYRVWMKHLRWTYRWRARFKLTGEHEEFPASERGHAVSALEERERYERLYLAMDQVAPKRRAVVLLHEIDGLNVEEIAKIVDAKAATVRTRLRDGRKQLKSLLSLDPYFSDNAIAESARQGEDR